MKLFPASNHAGPRTITLALAIAALACGGTPEIFGPSSGRIVFSPAVSLDSQAALDDVQDETGRMAYPARVPPPEWTEANGRTKVALLRLVAPGAAAYRIHFADLTLAPDTRMLIYGVDASGAVTTVHGPYTGSGPANGDPFRSRVVAGATAVIEVQSPESALWPFRIERVNLMEASQLEWLRSAGHHGLSRGGTTPGNRTLGYPCVVDGNERKCELSGDTVVIEGDIVVEDLSAPRNLGKAGSKDAFARANFGGAWPNGRIPYVVRDELRPGGITDPRITWAINTWNASIPGLLVQRTNEANYVEFRAWAEDFCKSSVGFRGGVQSVYVADDCGRGTIAHEIGHSAGLRHEHTRFDRDNYIVIFWNSIPDDWKSQYQIPASGELILGYDYNSIMHYGRTLKGVQVIETIPPGIPIGQRSGLTAYDTGGVRVVQCVVSLNPAPVQVPAEGGTYRVSVTVPSYCHWTASAISGWVSIVGNATGLGNGQFTVTVPANPIRHMRTGYVKVGRTELAIIQGARL